MNSAGPAHPSGLDPVARLTAIAEIKALKARYFLAYDSKDWAMWRDQVWAPEGRLILDGTGLDIGPRDEMIAWVARQTADQVSVHHGHTPIITLTSPTTATGIWAMEDRLYRSRAHRLNGDTAYVHGFGHYHETYVKRDCGWRIASTRLTRLHAVYVKAG